MPNYTWLYSIFFNHIASIQHFVKLRLLKRLKKEGVELESKRQLESRIFRGIKNFIYIPLIVWYLDNIVNTRIYRNKVEKNFLGLVKDYDTDENYVYICLIILNIPFRFFSMFKTAFYKIHIYYYLKLNRRIRHSTLYNARSNYSFNRFFSARVIHTRELERYTAFDTIERILNFVNIYSKKEYKDLAKEYIGYIYQINLNAATHKRREEYYDYFYFRTFGNYDPELEFYEIQKSRFFTRFWYYGTDFSYNLLSTHQLYMFFNYIHSPLHVRANTKSMYNFYYLLVYSKIYYYFYYFSYYFFPRFKEYGIFMFYINYFFCMVYSIFRLINMFIIFIFDGKSYIFLKYFWKNILYFFILFMNNKYFFLKYIAYFFFIVYIFFHYIITLFFVNLKLLILYIFEILFEFFSYLINTDLGRGYSFWHRYYMLKFYLIEYNIIYNIFVFFRNFLFNFFLILLIFFVLTTVPYIKELFFSEYFTYNFYFYLNRIFEYNKFIYFNEVLDNWWVPYFSPQKFINFYNGYCNYFEVRLKKLFGRVIVDAAHLGRRRYHYNMLFFDMYFKRRLYYLQWTKFNYIFVTFRQWIPGSFPWELYFYMHSYFWIAGHPARHFMPDIYFNTLPILWTFYWRYKYLVFMSKVFVPLYWFWKYSFSYIIFSFLIQTKDTIFFSYVLSFLKYVYNFYYKLNYNFFNFCYYYYFYFFFTVSKTMRYYFITYEALNCFWIYKSVRFMVIVDFINFLKLCLDSIYFITIEFCYGFFYFFYKIVYFVLNFFGLISFYNYFLFSLNFIPKFHIFISNWFDYLFTLNYDLDEYGRILSKHFRHRTRHRLGDWTKKDMAVSSVYKIIHRTISFEFKFRQFLFYMKKDLIKNFLVYNRIKVNTFNLFFFSFFSLYLNYVLMLLVLSFFSFKLRIFFKNDSILSSSPFFEWERFTKKNRHLVGRDEFYWLYNIRWLKKFDFYIDRYFSDDLYMRVFDKNDVKFGYYVYNQLNRFFITEERYLSATANQNRFLLYKRYYLQRYLSVIKDIDFIFYNYSISNKETHKKIFSYFDLFIPQMDEKKFDFNFKRDMVRGAGYADIYWLFFATPQLFYYRNWNFCRVLDRDEVTKEFYLNLKKSLFKAYSFYEMNRDGMNYDLFEFQFFEPEFYDDVLFENAGANKASDSNYFLHRIALSRWNTELVYVTPGQDIFELFAHVGYRDWVDKLEHYYNNLRNINSTYLNNFVDFGFFSFIEPVHSIRTHLDAEIVKNTIDLGVSDNAIGVKYSELYQYEDLGRVATEQYLFDLLDKTFASSSDPTISIVALTDDPTLGHKHSTTWTILTLFLPIIMITVIFQEYTYVHKYIAPHLWVRDALSSILYRIFLPQTAEIVLFHRLLTLEHYEHFYWFNPWTYIRTYVFDLYLIDNFSFWTGKHARFVQSKNEFLWIFSIINHDDFRYDNLSFLYWHFYIDAWRQCKESVIIFVLVDIFFYFLSILFFLCIFNWSLWFIDFYHYFSKKVHLVLDKDFNVDTYRVYEENIKKERERKKNKQFDFIDLDAFSKFKNKLSKDKKDIKHKKL